MKTILLLFLGFACLPVSTAEIGTVERPLRIGVFEKPPYAQRDMDGQWAGLAVDMWLAVAAKLGWEYEFVDLEPEAVYDAIGSGAVDGVVGELAVRADRERQVDFSHAYFGADLGIASLPGAWNPDWVVILRGVFNFSMVRVILIVLALLLVFSIALWIVENRGRIRWSEEKRIQLGDMWWFAIATLTTVGSSERGPRTIWGRMVGAAWMLASVLLIAAFTASVASSVAAASVLAHRSVDGDLYGRRIAAVDGSLGESYLEGIGIHPIVVKDISAGLAVLSDGKADFFVGDMLGLSYVVRRNFPGKFEVERFGWLQETVAFAFPTGSPHVKDLNIALLEVAESDRWHRNVDEWIGDLPGVSNGMRKDL